MKINIMFESDSDIMLMERGMQMSRIGYLMLSSINCKYDRLRKEHLKSLADQQAKEWNISYTIEGDEIIIKG